MQGKHIVMSAAGILAGGVCWAGALLMAPPPEGGDTEQIRQLARAANGDPIPPFDLSRDGLNVPTSPVEGSERPVKVTSRPATPPAASSAAPAVTQRPIRVERPTTVTAAPPQDNPVKNIALTGVTHQGGEDQALLLDLNSNIRETVRSGGSAFGFTVRKIEPESVVLARGPQEYTVRLGDKQVPTSEGSTSLASADDDGFGGREGFGGGRRGFRGGAGGFGGGNDADRERRRAEFFARMGGRFGGGRPNFGGQNFGGGQSFGSASATTFSSGGSDGDRSDRGGRRDNNGGRSFQTNFQPMPFMGGPMFFGMGRQNSNQPGFTNAPTSNPQTARRRGGQLVGGAASMDTPDPINNPQTQRRLGTSSSGPAFGQDQSSYNPYGNRTGSNRSGNTNGRGTTFR